MDDAADQIGHGAVGVWVGVGDGGPADLGRRAVTLTASWQKVLPGDTVTPSSLKYRPRRIGTMSPRLLARDNAQHAAARLPGTSLTRTKRPDGS